MTDHDSIETIKSYWFARGYKVKVEMRECADTTPSGHFMYKYNALRSNMLHGLPRDYRGELGV